VANKILFHPPIPAASFLNLSFKNHCEAELLKLKVFQKKSKHGVLPITETLDLFELRVTSVVFAYTALESFTNEEVPENYVYMVEDKNCTRHFNKKQIERFLNLDTKLGDVLPQVLKIKTPKGGKIWNAYIELGKLRDCIVHMKAKESFEKNQSESVWGKLLQDSMPPYKTAKDLMKYFFHAKRKSPSWFDDCPF
jgi:hypothetical protein